MIPSDPEDLWASIRMLAPAEGVRWLEEKVEGVAEDPGAIMAAFPAVGRKVGRTTLDPEADPHDLHAWRLDDAGRTLLLVALGDRLGGELEELYRYGDADERRGVLRALPLLPVGASAVPLVEDALRTNDTRLITAAMGPYAFDHLDDATLAQGVLKYVFLGIPISPLTSLNERATPEMARMLANYAHERVAAGRDVPAEVWPVIERFPPEEELNAIVAELDHPVGERRRAAERALAHSQVLRSRDANL
jgi:hypothetical protein